MTEKIDTLIADALPRFEIHETERLKLGHCTPQEIYWGGYLDALYQAKGMNTRSDLDWVFNGARTMFTKPEMDAKLSKKITECDACDLRKTRTQAVPGDGPLWTPFMVVGRDPGADEDREGRGFVGKSGQFLFDPETGVIPQITGYQRQNIRVSNICKCKSPGNRGPKPDEILSCKGYLRWEILNVRPKVIMAFGRVATSWFIGTDVSIGNVRGQAFKWEGITVVPTYHPSFILRNGSSPDLVDKIQQDLRTVLSEIQR